MILSGKRLAIAAVAAVALTGTAAGGAYAAGTAAALTPYAPVTSYSLSSTSSSVTVSWSANYGNGSGSGGAPIANIRVLVYDDASLASVADQTKPASIRTRTLTGLAAGHAYDVKIDVAATTSRSNSGWNTPRRFITTGSSGAPGPAGPQGPAGPMGPSGVVSAGVHDLGGLTSVTTGGGFVAGATEAGTISLAAGTYLLNLNAKATPKATGDTAQVFPQFFVYNQVKNAGFTGDLFNAGAGALEPDGTNHDSYYSGSGLFTFTSPVTLHVYAFGYDSDTGAGSYVLDDLSVTAIQVTPAA